MNIDDIPMEPMPAHNHPKSVKFSKDCAACKKQLVRDGKTMDSVAKIMTKALNALADEDEKKFGKRKPPASS